MIKYHSTNKKSKKVSFKTALFKGQAPDKGLFMPDRLPKFSQREINSMRRLKFPQIAFLILKKFLKGEIPEKTLKEITQKAFNFDLPIEKVSLNLFVLRLDRGPTASFKDFGARFLAKCMEYFLKKEKKKMVILVATSGDTGSAVAQAFYGIENVKVVVLFPEKEVVKNQRKQITTLGGNIISVAIKGKFDDCQAMVKKAFADAQLKHLNLSSANSINVARLIPQITYYFFAFCKICKRGEKVIFSVPCGNFGNLTAGIFAKRMGLPVFKFVAAVNENDEFPRFLETGKYKPLIPSKKCLSNAMNIGHPSNLARIVEIYGGRMDETGKILKPPDMNALKKEIWSTKITDKETKEAIKSAFQKYHLVLEPHGAVAWRALEKFLEKEKIHFPAVVLETAHLGKFPEILKDLLKIKIEIPSSIKNSLKKKEKFEILPPNYEEFKEFLKSVIPSHSKAPL